jgi:hypothetical protein
MSTAQTRICVNRGVTNVKLMTVCSSAVIMFVLMMIAVITKFGMGHPFAARTV